MSVSLWSTCSVSCLSDRTGIKGMHCDVDVVNPFRRWNLPSCDIFVFKITISVYIWFRTLEMHSSQWLFLQFTLAFSAQILWCLNVKIASSISFMLSCIASWENILWRRGVVVSGVRQWTKLTHVGPGYNWDGWPSSGGYTISGCNQPTRSTQPCIPPGSLNRVPASAGV